MTKVLKNKNGITSKFFRKGKFKTAGNFHVKHTGAKTR